MISGSWDSTGRVASCEKLSDWPVGWLGDGEEERVTA